MPNPKSRIVPATMPRVTPPRTVAPRPGSPGQKGVPAEGEWERITPETRAKVWRKRFGFRSTGTCVCCHRQPISRDDFACGLRRAYSGGGSNDVSNLEPICAGCKEQMGTHDLALWCRKVQEKLTLVKPMPKATTKKTVKKAAKKTTKKPVAKKTVKKTATKKAKR